MRPDIPRNWYAVYTAPRSERTADERLRRIGIYTFYPFCEVKRWRNLAGGKRVLVAEPRAHLPRYIFAFLGDGEFMATNETHGVVTIVSSPQTNRPLIIPDREMDRLMKWAEEHQTRDEREKVEFVGKVGDSFVFARTSPFAGLIATIESLADLDTKDQIVASLKMLGSDRSIPVPAQAVGEIIKH